MSNRRSESAPGRAAQRGGANARPAPRAPELLAPAGDADSLKVALVCGADAIYFGLQEGFNARARAGNFVLAALPETVAEIHRSGARAHLALNTLIFEPELPFVETVIQRAAEAGVDALLVQDPAVALIARRVAPGLELHASTQMTISSPDAAVFARDLGATRAVLPRELSLPEIRALVAGSDLEVEVFVHGALCVAWSGQCLTSEAWGGRSANRGQCAQSCRMPYRLVLDGQERDLGEVRYLLSPKDLAGAGAVPELVAIGVRGLKIEGRQKGSQYVATAVQGYRRWIDAVVRGEAESPAARQQLRDDLLSMSLAFSRGFGDGFLAGTDHQSLVDGRFPKHRGVYLGRVRRARANEVTVEPDRTDAASGAPMSRLEVRAGMGIVFDAGEPEDKNEPGGPVFRVEVRGRELVLGFGKPGPDLGRVAPGQRVWVTSDPALGRETERLLGAPLRRAKSRIHIVVAGQLGAPLRIEGRVGSVTAAVTTRTPAEPATGAGLERRVLREKLGALGGTPFDLAGLDASGVAPGLHVPVSELKAARRALVAELESAAAGAAPGSRVTRAAGPGEAPPVILSGRPRFALPSLAPPDAEPRVVPLCRSAAQLEAAIAAGLSEIELDWMDLVGLARAVGRARAAGMRVTLATLRVQKPGEEAFDGRLAALEPDGVLVRHWGGMVAFARTRAASPEHLAQVRIHGDFSLNVTNSVTAQHLFDWGLDTLTAAHDLDEAGLLALLAHVPAERMTVVLHHRIATFHTEHCVYAHMLSDGRDHLSCGRPCEQHEIGLGDHLGRVHPVIVDAGCRNTVFDSAVQSAARLVPRLLRCGVRRFRVEFVRETAAEAGAALAAYRSLLAGRATPEAVLRDLGVAARQGIGAGAMQLLG